MLFSSVASFVALLSVCTAAVAAPDVKTTTVTRKRTVTSTATATVTKRKKPITTTVTSTPTASPSCEAAVGYAPGGLFVAPIASEENNDFIRYCNNAFATMQADGNFVIYPGNDNSGTGYTTFTQIGPFCDQDTCHAEFTSDGDFQIVQFGDVVFSSNTAGQNAQRLVFSSGQPYVTIFDNNGNILFNTGTGSNARKFAAPSLPHPKKGHN